MSTTPPSGYTLPGFGGPGMPSFVRGDFDQEVDDFGLWTIWEQRYPCLCDSSDHGSPTEQPDVLCLKCWGSGDAYHSPVMIKVVYNQPRMTHNELVVWGDYLGGESIATPRSEFMLGHRHRLTVVDSVFLAEEKKECPERGELLEFRHPVASRQVEYMRTGINPCVPEAALDDGEDPCASSTYGRKLVTQRVPFLGYYTNRTETAKGDDHDVVVLEEGTDYVITEDGKIDLGPGEKIGTIPRPGTRMSAEYLAHPVWIVSQYAPYAAQFTYQTEQVPEPVLIELPKSMKCELDHFGHTHPKYYDVRDLARF